MKLRVKGVSFNFSHQDLPNLEDYINALRNVREVFEQSAEIEMPKLDFINIGGGFTMANTDKNGNFVELAYNLSKVID